MHKLKNQTKNQEGFTIIEVMIVLVIAAIILLIVFLAVPALQRNSRNNQRKNDVSRISAAATEAANNANGTLQPVAQVNALTGTLGFYSAATEASGAGRTAPDANTVIYVTEATCAKTGGVNNGTTAGGTDRQFAVVYAVETSNPSDPSEQCIES